MVKTVCGPHDVWDSPKVVCRRYSTCPCRSRPKKIFGDSNWKGTPDFDKWFRMMRGTLQSSSTNRFGKWDPSGQLTMSNTPVGPHTCRKYGVSESRTSTGIREYPNHGPNEMSYHSSWSIPTAIQNASAIRGRPVKNATLEQKIVTEHRKVCR
jgi:hypothetical protein